MSSVAKRVKKLAVGESQRIVSSTRFSHGTSPASRRSRCSGRALSARTALTSRCVVVSWPAASTTYMVTTRSSRGSRSSGGRASIALIMSSPGSRSSRDTCSSSQECRLSSASRPSPRVSSNRAVYSRPSSSWSASSTPSRWPMTPIGSGQANSERKSTTPSSALSAARSRSSRSRSTRAATTGVSASTRRAVKAWDRGRRSFRCSGPSTTVMALPAGAARLNSGQSFGSSPFWSAFQYEGLLAKRSESLRTLRPASSPVTAHITTPPGSSTGTIGPCARILAASSCRFGLRGSRWWIGPDRVRATVSLPGGRWRWWAG